VPAVPLLPASFGQQADGHSQEVAVDPHSHPFLYLEVDVGEVVVVAEVVGRSLQVGAGTILEGPQLGVDCG
jgi:hypothetical protein